jgi:hypothetical protein
MSSIFMFDDDLGRCNRCFAAISKNSHGIALTVRHTPQSFIDTYLAREGKPDLIALHCSRSYPSRDRDESADIHDVSRFLADSDAVCPVLIYSADNAVATTMLNALLDGGWIAIRFRTFGQDWIECSSLICLSIVN